MKSLSIDHNFINFLEAKKLSYSKPLFIYNLDLIKERLSYLKNLGRLNKVQIIMALKSFNHIKIHKSCYDYIDGFDISNEGEWNLIRHLSKKKIISITGPCLNIHHINKWSNLPSNALVNISDADQLKQAIEVDNPFGIRISINLSLDKKSIFSRFGLEMQHIKRICSQQKIVGLHFHRGFGNNKASFYLNTLKEIYDLTKKCNLDLKYINCGGGYKNIDMEKFFPELRKIIPKHIDLIIEPGDFLFENSGFLLSRITGLKSSKNIIEQIVLDSSKDCHLKWSKPFYLFPRQNNAKLHSFSILGASCYENDLIGHYPVNISIKKLRKDPFVVLGGVTGYSYSWNKSFNGVPEGDIAFYEK